jgi:hypothetical protein
VTKVSAETVVPPQGLRNSCVILFSLYRPTGPRCARPEDRLQPVSTAQVGPGLCRESDRRGCVHVKLRKHLSLLPPAALSIAALIAPVAVADQSDMISEPVAVLQGLDKITARVSEITAPVGQTVRFGTLEIMVRACEKNPPEDRPEDAAFLQIDEVRPGEDNVRRFSGWMFAQSPALSSLEHPVYDVILLDCKGASASAEGSPAAASGNSSGNQAR